MFVIEINDKNKFTMKNFIKLDVSNIDEAKFEAKKVYENGRYDSVCVRETTEDFYKEYLKAAETMDDYEFIDWMTEHDNDMCVAFTVDSEEVAEEIYFKWQRADKDIEGAIFYYEHSTGNKVEDGCSMQVGRDSFGDYWFAFDEEDEDLIEDLQSFHNANGRDIHKWQEWYKKEWIIDVTKQEIERLAKYENKGYKWVLKP